MKKFITDIKKYYGYAVYSARCDLKSEVSGSYLNWLWWILDPLFFMLVYMFIALVVFGRGEEYFPIFVFSGLTIWMFFSKNVSGSVKLIKSNKSTVTRIYVPKFILVLQQMFVNLFKMGMSFVIIAIMLILFRVPQGWMLISLVPIMLSYFIVTFGICALIMHMGVFAADLSNIVTILLRLMMYMSGIFYSVSDRVPAPYNTLMLTFNPTAFFMHSIRQVLLYQTWPDWFILLGWTFAGVLISSVALNLIYKYENSYAKVML